MNIGLSCCERVSRICDVVGERVCVCVCVCVCVHVCMVPEYLASLLKVHRQ